MTEDKDKDNAQEPQLTVDLSSDEADGSDGVNSSYVVAAPDEPATTAEPQSDDKTDSDDSHPTLGEVVAKRAVEEDRTPTSGLSFGDVIGGEILNTSTVRKQIGVLLFVAFFIIVYISNRYSYEQGLIKLSNLRTELQDIRYKQRAISSELTEHTRKSKVIELLKQCQDSTLHTSNEPPYKINIPTTD